MMRLYTSFSLILDHCNCWHHSKHRSKYDRIYVVVVAMANASHPNGEYPHVVNYTLHTVDVDIHLVQLYQH
jgi:hypothetical protein